MINKISTGVEFIDKELGGLYQYGAYLLCGERESGKTLLASGFLAEGLKKHEMCLYITGENAVSYINEIQNIMGFDFSMYLQQGLFNILQYEKPKEGSSSKLPQYFHEAGTFINGKGVERVVIDFSTVKDLLDEKKTEENIKDFIKFIERFHVTTVILLDKAASPEMSRIERMLIKETVGTFRMEQKYSERSGRNFFEIEIEKTAGLYPPYPSWSFEVIKNEGFKLVVKRAGVDYSVIKDVKKVKGGG